MPHVISNQPMHIHPVLAIRYQGQPVEVPADIGIDPTMYATHRWDKYIGDMGAAPIHTHDTSGKLHVESSVTANWTLGNFLSIWGLELSGHKVNVYVDGNKISSFKRHVLQDKEQIVMDIDP